MLWEIRALMKPALSVIDLIPNVHRTPALTLLRRTVLDGRPAVLRLSGDEKELAFQDTSVPLTSPMTMATCSTPVPSSLNTFMVKVPCSVGTRASASKSTSAAVTGVTGWAGVCLAGSGLDIGFPQGHLFCQKPTGLAGTVRIEWKFTQKYCMHVQYRDAF